MYDYFHRRSRESFAAKMHRQAYSADYTWRQRSLVRSACGWLGVAPSPRGTSGRCYCTALGCNRRGNRHLSGLFLDRHRLTQLVRGYESAVEAALKGRRLPVAGKGHAEPTMDLRSCTGRERAGTLRPVGEGCALSEQCYLTRSEAEAWVDDGRCHRHRLANEPCTAFVAYRAWHKATLRDNLAPDGPPRLLSAHAPGYRWVERNPGPGLVVEDEYDFEDFLSLRSPTSTPEPLNLSNALPADVLRRLPARHRGARIPARPDASSPDASDSDEGSTASTDTAEDVEMLETLDAARNARLAAERQAERERNEAAAHRAYFEGCAQATTAHALSDATVEGKSKMLAEALAVLLKTRDEELAYVAEKYARREARAAGEGPGTAFEQD